jgi:multiple sugar transport system permease protein
LHIGVVIRAMGAIKIFDSVFILTGGGPGNATEVINIWLYKNTLEFFRIGFASAAAWVVFLIAVGVFSYTLAPLLYETEVYEDEGIISDEGA